jgi:aspartate carbamoyltransferase
MASPNPFLGRTLAAAGDLSVDEQRYLYEKTRELKQAWSQLEGGDVTPFRIEDPELNVYLMFLEPSTRTRESFRSAANFHNVTLSDFDASTSSFTKQESIIDTIKMLVGYGKRTVFIMRTKMEGVCLALEEQLAPYAERIGRAKPIFINAGDGRHEHPTQEFLDEFTFLEQRNWDESSIHLALIGDLLHGRTVHSKAEGLKIFRKVVVDLVAPRELALPETYKSTMIENGFEVREYPSIEEYLKSGNVSTCWYFTRLQLERMGDEIREREPELRTAVTFQKQWMAELPEGTKFYHPLPRHRETPVIPTFLDETPLNGWEGQAINGYFTRIIELAMVTGQIGHDFKGVGLSPPSKDNSFVTEVPVTRKTHVEDRFKVGIKPVDDGLVIDHIARGKPVEEIWDRISKIRRILKLNVRGSHGVFHCSDAKDFKGIMSLPDVMEMSPVQMKKLAAVSPGCTINFIKDASVLHKYRLAMPPRIYKFDEISCKNADCITSRNAHQNVSPYFYQTVDRTFTCKYCGKRHKYPDIWDL